MERPWIKNIHALILDMDGVLWRGDDLLVDMPETFKRIRALGLNFALATNNSSRTQADYVAKFAQLGVELSSEQVVNSADATARYLRARYPTGGSLYVIGEAGLLATLRTYGFHVDSSADVQAVVAGIDRNLTYAKLRRACLLIRAGADFFGTNPDRSLPDPAGQIPGAGAILAALEAASGVSPVVIGKPAAPLFQQAMGTLGSLPEHTLVIGDRLETDIVGGKNAGCRTALVLSGVTKRSETAQSSVVPDLIAPSLTDILDHLKR